MAVSEERTRSVRVEDNKVILETAGFCPNMEAVRIMKAPWETVCRNYSWRVFEGLAAGVNPNATMETQSQESWAKTAAATS